MSRGGAAARGRLAGWRLAPRSPFFRQTASASVDHNRNPKSLAPPLPQRAAQSRAIRPPSARAPAARDCVVKGIYM